MRWFEDINLKGPVFICSTVCSVTSKDVADFISKYKLGMDRCISFHSPPQIFTTLNLQVILDNCTDEGIDFSPANILGRAYVSDCITYKEFDKEVIYCL